MGTLPSRLIDLRSDVPFQRRTFSEIGLRERDLDDLVKSHGDVLADLLVENDIMEEAGRLRYLGRQFHHIDVLFAEVDEEDEPIRLVLVEDKLLKNPGARRSVIGQVVEYAARLQDEVTSDSLKEHFPEQAGWLDQNAELLDRQIEAGDFLLVICGDTIHSNVADVVTRLARRADRYPLSGMELCLVGMDIYERNTEQILIPHVIGTVIRAERQLQIRIVNSNGEPVRAVAEAGANAGTGARKKPSRTEAEFFELWGKKFGDQAPLDWQAFIEQITDAELPGVIVSRTSVGRPTVKLRSAQTESLLPVLRARTSAAGVRDVCGTRTWERSQATVKAREDFRAALRRIPSATVRADGAVMLPVDTAKAEGSRIVEALRQLARSLEAE